VEVIHLYISILKYDHELIYVAIVIKLQKSTSL